MRRMYSEQELTNIIKEVFDAEVASGVFDDQIKEYAEDWLEENPLTPSDLDFSSIDFVAKTLVQTNANWTGTPSSSSTTEGIELNEDAFVRYLQVGNILWFIVSAIATNTSESDISDGIIGFNIYPNSAISAKIYRADGTACNGAYTTSEKVLYSAGMLDGDVKPVDMNSYSANQLVAYMRNVNINAGASKIVSIRIPLILL
ncbi:MAG: hypothetical protein J6S85_21480 [Methanobrevibacter sp.]|nr:hypothetical protein [Methanobrevibacter sp.]